MKQEQNEGVGDQIVKKKGLVHDPKKGNIEKWSYLCDESQNKDGK